MFSCFLKMAQVYLLLAGCRVYKGHLQNEWVIKTVREPPKENLSALNPALNPAQSMHILYPFCRNSKISRNSSYRFLWNFTHQKTSTQSIRSVKLSAFPRKCRLGQKFDLGPKLFWRHCHVIYIPIAQNIIS